MSTDTLPRIRVLLVDDHLIVRMGLAYAINNQPDMQVIAQAEDGVQGIELYRKHLPDVVILDLRMPQLNGIEAIKQLRKEFGDLHVLVLSNYMSGNDISAALQAGAKGFVGKDTGMNALMDAIRRVHQGEQYLPSGIAVRLASHITSQLSQRELDVLILMGKGQSNKEIGATLNIVESTVKVHVTNILSKLGVADRTQAVLAGIKRGIIELE